MTSQDAIMEPTLAAAQVRALVVDCFARHGVIVGQNDALEERVRVENGRRVAHCYRAQGLFAMWMVEIGLVQLYDQSGNMLDTLSLLASTGRDRRAA
jgi:hypothetical protein